MSESSSPVRVSLQPFAPNQRNGLDVNCLLGRSRGHLYLEFTITGEVGKLVIPERHARAHRKDQLWGTTCFESFFKIKDSASYWEVNVSPSGCWNIYRFSDYRKEMTEETSVSAIASKIFLEKNMASISISLPVSDLVSPDQELITGVSCVLEFQNGEKHYWAITHPGDQPDFHHPGNMLLRVNES